MEETLIKPAVAKLLTQQIGHELSAHQTYFGIRLYFERLSLERWAQLFRAQSMEEAQHAAKIIDFLIDNEIGFELPPIRRAPTTYPSASAAIRVALANELLVTEQFNTMAAVARDEGDHRTLQFLQWFIEEQVEEERTMRRLLDLVESGINLFVAESHLEAITAE